MNNIQRVIEESNTKINKILVTLTDITGFDHSGKSLEAFHVAETELKTHIPETIRQVLQAVEEEVEGKKIIEKSVVKISYGTGEDSEVEVNSDRAVFYNSALSDIQSLLKSAKENIK